MSYISLRQGKVLYRTPSSNSEHGIYGNFFPLMKLPNYILKINQVQKKLLNLNLHKILNF